MAVSLSLTLTRISGTFSIDSVRIQAGCVALSLPPSLPSLLRRAAPITQNNMQWQTTWASSELVVKLLNAIGLDASFLYRAEITTVAWISTLTICPGPALLRFANNFAHLCKYL